MNKFMHQHGGDLDAIERQYNIKKEEIKDFSGNINPLGFPANIKNIIAANLDIIKTYPDKKYTALRQSIAAYTGAELENISVGNGSTELISIFIKSVNARNTLILGPAYSEYEHAASLTGGQFSYFPLKEHENFQINIPCLLDALTPEIGLFIACNPNNPTGSAITVPALETILSHCKMNQISVMIDETYIEFSDNLEEICAIPLTKKYDNLFVIRGISKFFAAPGLRLGYAVTSSEKFHALLQQNQDPWSVNILASFAGEQIFSEKEFMLKSKILISEERKKAFKTLLSFKNIKAYPSSANFILVKILNPAIKASTVFEYLIQKKMLVRDAASFTFLDESYLRFCILSPADNTLLLSELKNIVG